MSKKYKGTNLPTPSWGNGYTVSSEFFDHLIGKVLTTIEVMGLTEKQEESAKSLIRQGIWNQVSESAIWISAERHTEIRNLHYQKMRENPGTEPGSSAI